MNGASYPISSHTIETAPIFRHAKTAAVEAIHAEFVTEKEMYVQIICCPEEKPNPSQTDTHTHTEI